MEDFIDIAVLVIVYFAVFYKKWRQKGNDVFLVNTAMYLYLSAVLYFTLMPIIAALPFIFDHPYVPMNLEPFIDVTLGRGDFSRQIILNIIMAIPFGLLLPLVQTVKGQTPTLLKTFLLTFLLSFSIEIIQPLLSSFRSSDITDVINNVLGGLLGYLSYLILKPLLRRVLALLKTSPERT